MSLRILTILCALITSSALMAVEINRYDPRASEILPEAASIEKIADGFSWVEGPAWQKKDKFLVFSDIPNNVIWKWKEGEGTSIYMRNSGYQGSEPFKGKEPGSNGLAWDNFGNLYICEHGNRRVTKLDPQGVKTIIADNYEGRRLNSPNDVIVTANGDVLFTDPPYGLADAFEDSQKELSFQGVYRWSNGNLELLTDKLKAPNGLGISPDGSTLYVSNSDPEQAVWYAFDYRDNKVNNPRILTDVSKLTKERTGLPDGFTISQAGYLFAAGPGGLYILAPDGVIVAFIDFKHAVSNCTWGEDQKILYITGSQAVYRLKL